MAESGGLRVVGAGLGRTATLSLKVALERLLGDPCYHMTEVFPRPEHVARWREAAEGRAVDWRALFDGFGAAVDWPTCSFWREISAEYPDAVVLLSTRADAEEWWRSANATIFGAFRTDDTPPELRPFRDMWFAIARNRFTEHFLDADAAMAAYDAHNAAVRTEADPARLVDWQPGDGWQPIAAALGVPVPDEPFPHTNTTEEFLARFRTPSA